LRTQKDFILNNTFILLEKEISKTKQNNQLVADESVYTCQLCS